MDSQYSEDNSMESHTEDDSSITTEERDENSSEEEQSSITTSEEEIDPWSTLINDAASKLGPGSVLVRRHLASASHRGSWQSEAKQEAFEKILPVFQKEIGRYLHG